MADQLIAELESSAQILLAPPNIVTSQQRHAAEGIFLNFQKTKSPFHLCQYILENTRVDYVKFQAASLLKHSVIREWSLLEKPNVETLRASLLQYVIQNPSMQSFVREQLLLVVAIMVKRSTVDGENEVVQNVLNEVSRLISSGDPPMQTIGCSILTSLLNEYSSTTRASDVGLTWEKHLIAKKKFETTDLKKIFHYCLEGLNELNRMGNPISAETSRLLKKFLIIVEHVLTWNFRMPLVLPWKLIGLFESQQRPALRPSSEWKDVFLDPALIQLFFKLHWQVCDNPDLSHHTLQCLNQLASLSGVVMNNKEDRCSYLSWFMEGMLNLLSLCSTVREHEALGISNIISRLGVFFPASVMTTLPADILQTYLIELTKLTCLFAESASQEETLNKDDQVFMEAFEHLLDSWVTILQDVQNYPQDIIKQSAIEIFNKYLQYHLAPPEGSKGVNSAQDCDEIDENEEDDRTRFKDQLSVIGLLGRQALEYCVPVLTKLLEEKISALHSHLHRIHQQSMMLSDSTILDTLNEDIHWLVMIIGHLLAPVSEGETSLIPMEVTRYCIEQSGSVNMEATLHVLASPSHKVSDIPGAEQCTDPVVRLISAVFRMCEIEKRAMEANLMHILSPEVAITLVWFLSRWSVTYLLPNEMYYTEMSMTLIGAFGRDSEAGFWTLNFVLSKLEANLTLWFSEPKLACMTAQSLVAVLNNTERGNRAGSCDSLISLVKKQSSGQFQQLPTSAKRSLLKALVIVGTANKDNDSKDRYWEELFSPLQEKFCAIMGKDNFIHMFHTKQIKSEVLDLIECLVGVADGCTMQNLPQFLPFGNSLMEELVKLVDVYHNYSDVIGMIFQFFCTVAKRVLCFLNQSDSRKMYECCLNMIQTYAKHNVGKLSREATAEEEQYQDILVLMQLLTDLLSKDFIDFTPSGVLVRHTVVHSSEPQTLLLVPDDSQENSETAVSAADIALCGLNIIMPLMNAELLKFPSLCLQYFKLITFVCEIYPNKICQLPEGLFKTLLTSVELGLTSFTPEVASLCLDFLSILGVYVYKSNLQSNPAGDVLQPFLKLVMDMVLLQPLDADLTQIAGSTLFTLICCFQEKYQEIVQSLIQGLSDPSNAQRMVMAFNHLTVGVQLLMDRHNRVKFKNNFEKFITDVRGFMCVK